MLVIRDGWSVVRVPGSIVYYTETRFYGLTVPSFVCR